jgi:hypothetical protein
MATTLLLRSAFQYHDATPKNQAVVTTHFSVGFDPIGFGDVNATQLCTDLADRWPFLPGLGATTPFTVSAYKRGGAKLGLPVGKVARNPTGTPKNLPVIPEAAVVLSYYAGQNAQRHRGRMYLPAWLLGATSSDMVRSVPQSIRDAAAGLVTTLQGLGGVNVDWGVWSEADHTFRKATNYFVSDAWAIQRRRGIKETARNVGTTTG